MKKMFKDIDDSNAFLPSIFKQTNTIMFIGKSGYIKDDLFY
jgi:hypothetical protein